MTTLRDLHDREAAAFERWTREIAEFCEDALRAITCLCGGQRGWHEAEDGDKYCDCEAGDKLREREAMDG